LCTWAENGRPRSKIGDSLVDGGAGGDPEAPVLAGGEGRRGGAHERAGGVGNSFGGVRTKRCSPGVGSPQRCGSAERNRR
jgi:hypothetical protein